ncbi:MAG: nuclear transport factor 2 family protein [Rhizobiales bacterium]|nr:nuclear transport factor 2 family protein [Hyphomicrobiales bacterium]
MDGADLMRKVVAAFEKSDLQPLFDAVHENIVWKTASQQEGLFRFGGEYKDRSGLLVILANLSKDYTFYRFHPKEIISAGDIVWGHFDVGLFFDPKGAGEAKKHITLEMAVRWRLEDGKIIEHQGFFDTASLLIQQGSRVKSAPQP